MGSVNKVTLLGNLGQDPEGRSTVNGTKVATLNIATSESWTKDGKKEERVEWHRVVLWDKLADLACQYLKKGSKIYIEGKLATRSWDDQSGVKRYITEVVGSHLVFIDSARKGNSVPEPSHHQSSRGHSAYTSAVDDDVPF